MKIPTPQECGLPQKFDKWRPKQADALGALLRNTKRVGAVSMPTGGGKSPLLVAFANLTKVPTCIVTNSRGLQSQYMHDFADIGMVDIRGRSNYSCNMRPDYTCEEGYAANCTHKGTVMCGSSEAEMRAASSTLVVTNYAKWTSSRKFGMGLAHIKHVVFDEGHAAYEALASAMQITLHSKEVEETLGIPFPDHQDHDKMMEWKRWASSTRWVAEDAMNAARARLVGVQAKASWVKHFTHMRNLVRRLTILQSANAQEWVVDEIDGGYQFDPVRPGRYSEAALLLKVPKITIGSATLRPKALHMIGIGAANYDFKEYDSDFDPKRCPIYYVPTMPVDIRHPDQRALWLLHDQIAARRKDRNGIVHTISYARRDDVMQHSRFAEQMLFNVKGEAPAALIDKFIHEYPGKILVSPSVGTGYDFKYKAAEWQFLCKIPFPDSRSKIVKARQHDDKEYGAYIAVQYLVQAFGRIMREKDDQGENFIGDTHIEWFLPRFAHLFPKSFHSFFKRVSTVPAPPQRLP